MSRPWQDSVHVIRDLRAAWDDVAAAEDAQQAPAEVLDWLARLRLLHGVPFAYLVVDDALLPPESIRFFWLDRDWTDAAVEGALSAAGASSSVRSIAVSEDGRIRARLDRHERTITPHDPRLVGVERPPAGGPVTTDARHAGQVPHDALTGPAGTVTGFLLRSKAVSGWPELHVRALDADDEPVVLLRVERLAPAVLLVLVDGCPVEVQIEEPRRGLQFGVDLTPGTVPAGENAPDEHSDGGRRLALRDPIDGQFVLLDAHGARVANPPTGEPDPAGSQRVQVTVPFHERTTGLVDMAALAAGIGDAVDDSPGAGLSFTADDDGEAWPHGVSTAELTTQLLQFPYQQRFRGNGERPDGFVITVLAVTTPLSIAQTFTAIEHID